MSSHKAYGEATKTTAVDGEVVLDGPDGVGLSMTPEAADETARRLHKSSQTAARQKRRSETSGDGPQDHAPDTE